MYKKKNDALTVGGDVLFTLKMFKIHTYIYIYLKNVLNIEFEFSDAHDLSCKFKMKQSYLGLGLGGNCNVDFEDTRHRLFDRWEKVVGFRFDFEHVINAGM